MGNINYYICISKIIIIRVRISAIVEDAKSGKVDSGSSQLISG